MDRDDQKRDVSNDKENMEPDNARHGDVLGLGGGAVPKAPGDPSAQHDAESEARRHSRALGEEGTSGLEPADPSNQGGATGIDMGAGGQGTLLRRPRSGA